MAQGPAVVLAPAVASPVLLSSPLSGAGELDMSMYKQRSGEVKVIEQEWVMGREARAGDVDKTTTNMLRVDGWNLLGFLVTQMFCLVMAVRKGFLVPWQAAMVCNVLTGSVLALWYVKPMVYLSHRFAFLLACRAACTFGALFGACGLVQSMALKMQLGHFDLEPGAAGLAAMSSCTMFKSTFLKEQMGRSSTFFHVLEVLGIGLAGLKTYPQLFQVPHVTPVVYWGIVISVWGLLPLLISSCVLRIALPPQKHAFKQE